MNLKTAWQQGVPFADFARVAEENRQLWDGVYRTARIPDWAVDKACTDAKNISLLVIAEDWCGDASNTVPVLAKLADLAGCLDLRVILRDEHPELMNQFLTDGSRSIPIVIALDPERTVVGHWGPRPAELQQWVMENKDATPGEELYPKVRRWYAKDRGESTLREVLALFDPQE